MIYVLAALAVVAFAIGAAYYATQSEIKSASQCWRKVVRREPGEQGELVWLECGHACYMMGYGTIETTCEACARGEKP